MDLRTEHRKKLDARNLALYNEYNQLMAQDGAMAGVVTEFIMKKYNIFGASTVWLIRKDVAKKLGHKLKENRKK
jgi:hypothetical protein